MQRREFITLLGGAAAAWPFAAQAQPKPIAQLGVLLYSDPQSDPQMASIRHGLSDLGYVEGRNIAIEYRYAQGRVDRLPSLAAELGPEKLQPNVILAIGGDVAPIAKRFNQTIPLVFVSSADPEQLGLVASLVDPAATRPALRCCKTHSRPSVLSFLGRLHRKSPGSRSSGIRIIRIMNSGRPNALHKHSVCNFTWLKCAALTISSRRFAPPITQA